LATLCIEKQLLDDIDTEPTIVDFASRSVRRNCLSDFHVVVFSVAFMLYFALINMLLLLIMNFINEIKYYSYN
jgi:hypothetical protein